jgi:hypothetical protein
MAATAPATSSDHPDRDHPDRDDSKAQLGQAVVVQLAVQGWATAHRSGPASPPDDPCDPAA